jgi:GrpB-like predicted nucleotidyltransferase (UPF0157 family)
VRFRDALRADPDLRHGYERAKRRAAAAHAGDQDDDDYTRDKARWFADVLPRVDIARDPWPRDPG